MTRAITYDPDTRNQHAPVAAHITFFIDSPPPTECLSAPHHIYIYAPRRPPDFPTARNGDD